MITVSYIKEKVKKIYFEVISNTKILSNEVIKNKDMPNSHGTIQR